MAVDERLVVMLEARVTEFEKRMRQAEQRGTRTYQGLQRRSRSATRGMEADMVRSTTAINRALATTAARIGAFGAAFAVARGVQGYNRLADAATAMANSLRVAGLEGAELTRVYEQLFASAQRNSAPINSLVDLYSKLALTQTELGVSSDELIHFTDGIAVALKVAGTDATAASGSLLQLSQALGGGVVRAEEFNSILEGTPTIAQAVARGLKEAGGSVAELRKLVVNGEVSSRTFFRAFEAGSAELRRQAETSQSTVGQSMTRLGNSLVTVVGKFDQASGASKGLTGIIGDLAEGLDNFDVEGFISDIQRIIDKIDDAEEAAAGWLRQMANAQAFADLNEAMGITEGEQIINPDVREAEKKINILEREIEILQANIEKNTRLGFDASDSIARIREVRAELAALRAEAANLPRYVAGLKPDGTAVYDMVDTGTPVSGYSPPPMPAEPVSIADFPADRSGSGSGGGGRRRRRRGGGGKAQQDDFAKEVEATRERTAALEAEAAVLAAVAISGKDYGDAMEFARKKAELLTAAQKAGKEITPELEAEIDAMADAYTQAGLAAEGAAEKLDLIKERSQAGKDALTDMFGSIIDGSMSAKEAVANLLMEIAKAQLISGIMGLPGMGGVASGIGSLLIPGFAKGGMHSGGVRLVGEEGPEVEATGPARYWTASQMANAMQGSSGSQASGSQDMNVHVTVGVDENGNLQPFVDKRVATGVQMGISRYDKDSTRRWGQNYKDWQNRRM
ncbi:tape measure protein [Paracoccus saliphilus]|uniref:Tape measure domain-containing protein n=1 Tax=Paracoccus saliphilus TaxID=405559 RepID=A0AA45W2B8_9RHOB|nr:tape measure protein [Paracoccus saliphilus]WCR01915.1 tape measure protein [Paracoccus saliphilus]SIS65138.1 tape measure domain-containing protein [Paracoccus saliphilus]